MYPNFQLACSLTIKAYLCQVWSLLSADGEMTQFRIDRTRTEHFIPLTSSVTGPDAAIQFLTLCFADEIGEPSHNSANGICGYFTSDAGEYVAFWNHNTSKWIAHPSGAKMGVVYILPETTIEVWSETENPGGSCEKFTASPIFLDPKTGTPSRFYYPEEVPSLLGQILDPEKVQIAAWTYHPKLRKCVWAIQNQFQ